MKQGHLSEYFTGVAVKRLSAVEASGNQHEFNGVGDLKKVLRRCYPRDHHQIDTLDVGA